MIRPTTRERALLLFVLTYTTQNGYPPTTREVAEARGVGLATAHAILRTLRHKGLLGNTAYRQRRSLVVVAL